MKVEDLLFEKSKDYFYIMHLSYEGQERERLWNYAKENDFIGLSKGAVTDDWSRVREAIKESLPPIWVKQFDTFCSEMKVGDIVLVLVGWDSLLGIAEITKQHHQYDENLSQGTGELFFDHVRQVKWIKKYEYADRLRIPQRIRGFNNTLSKVEPRTHRWSILNNIHL